MKNYNRQPYGKNGDTTGFRNLEWYKDQVYPLIDDFSSCCVVHGGMQWRRVLDKCIDVGCGNGRHFPFLARIFKSIYGIDPVESLSDKYTIPQAWFSKCSLAEVLPPCRFDGVFFFGSGAIIKRYYGIIQFFQVVMQLVSDTGFICIVSDPKDGVVFNGLNSLKRVTSDNTTCVDFYSKKEFA